jgi:arsenate reductase
VIRGIGEVAASETRTPAEYADTIGSILEEVDRLTLLRLSHGDAGTIALSREPVDLAALARDAASSLGVLAEERSPRIDVRAPVPVRVAADRLVVRETITNVLDNAIKYSAPASTIAIEVASRGDEATIAIADEGPGIPPEHRDRDLRSLLSRGRGTIARRRRRRPRSGDSEVRCRRPRRTLRARHGRQPRRRLPDHASTGKDALMTAPLLAVFLALAPQTSSAAPPSIVFVCEHGAAKSVIATAYFNKIAAERRLPFRATFRGTAPQDDLSVRAVAGLRADGVVPPDGKPAAISDADVAAATHIFAIGCTLPEKATRSGKADDWSDVPDDQGYGPMRDAIVRHVTALVDRLQAERR